MTKFNISRFLNLEERIYECEVVTPMFLGGANIKISEIRTQSIKGALRFWWRAIYGKKYSLEEMKKKETKIFGNTEQKSNVTITIDGLNSVIKPEELSKVTSEYVINILHIWHMEPINMKKEKEMCLLDLTFLMELNLT